MKTSWIIGCVMMYLLIFFLELFATGGHVFSTTTSSNMTNMATTNQASLMAPTFAESTNVFTGAWAVVTGVAPYLKIILQMLFLWMPTVFAGYLVWFWWFICFPIDCGMVVSIVFIARGVHSA